MDQYSKYLANLYKNKLIDTNNLYFIFTSTFNFFKHDMRKISENNKYKLYNTLDDILYTDGWSPFKNLLGMYAILEAGGTIRFAFSCNDIKNIKNIHNSKKRLMVYVEYCIIMTWKNISINTSWRDDLLCIDISKKDDNISIQHNIENIQYIIDDFAIGDATTGFNTMWKTHWKLLNADNLIDLSKMLEQHC